MDWDTCVLLGLIAIGLAICSIILCSLIHTNHILKPTDKIKASVLYTTYCSILLFMLCLISNLMNFEIIQDLSFVARIIWNNIAVVTWNVAQILVFILLMLRIYHTFNDTIFEVSKCVYITFGSLLFAYIICCVIWVLHNLIILKIYYKNELELYDTYKYLNTGYVIAVEIIDLVISLILIVTFIKQMIRVTVALRDDLKYIDIDTNNNAPVTSSNEDQKTMERTISSKTKSLQLQHRSSLNLNSNQTEILDAVTKYSVLSVIATLCSQLNTLVFAVALIIEKIYPGDWARIWGSSVGGIFFCIDCIINPICLYLLFAANRKWYQLFCGKCHGICGFCLRDVTQKRVKKKYLKLTQDQMQMQLYDDSYH